MACKTYPDLYVNVAKLADESKNPQLAALARQQEITRWSELLAANPMNQVARIHLVQLLQTDAEGFKESEQLLKEGINLRPTPLLKRALSDVYRRQFVRDLAGSEDTVGNLVMLNKAIQVDPTNPLVALQISDLVKKSVRPIEDLSSDLHKVLASGAANVAVHALLAEIELTRNNPNAAKMHLKQVFHAAPTAAKYADQLMQLYLADGKFNEAIQAGQRALSQLRQDKLLKARFVDGLQHTMGLAYLRAERHAEAVTAFEGALAANPNRLDTRQVLAESFRRVGNDTEAAKHEQFIEAHATSESRISDSADASDQ